MGAMKIERQPARVVKPAGASAEELGSWVVLSNLDLIMPRAHVEVLFAYDAPAAPSTPALESGLAKVLAHYREWAGRISTQPHTGRPALQLTDDGVVVIEASADGPLSNILAPFIPSHHLLQLIPINRGAPELLLIQLTRFTCGGLALGMACHHHVADGEAAMDFFDAWAATVRGLPVPFAPLHDRSALMAKDPPQPLFEHPGYKKPSPSSNPNGLSQEQDHPDIAVNRLSFSLDLLKKIKERAVMGAPAGVTYTTFESLLAHMWRCITKARGLEMDDGETRALVSVNARKRLNPPLPKGYFGNVICHACPRSTINELLRKPLSFAAGIVHDAIQSVTNDYVRSALDFIEIQQKDPVQIARTNKTVLTPNLGVTTWATLSLYKLDFGLGTPVFAGNACIPPWEGLVVFAPTKDGSIDVSLGLFAPDMAKLEAICYDLEWLDTSE